MKSNYEELSKKYDLARVANMKIIERFTDEINISENMNVLDFGCGTGNYAYAMKKITNANIYGIEPSDGMREKAIAKSNDIVFLKGDHSNIPFNNEFFDFIYMTDVIHHVPDLNIMFNEFYRVLKKGGFICILTESYDQLESRFWVKYFPTTVDVEKSRYPDIPRIIDASTQCNISHYKTINTDSYQKNEISLEFMNLVENKGYSMFHLISSVEFDDGLNKLREDYNNKVQLEHSHGETFLWLSK